MASLSLTCEAGRTWEAQSKAPVKRLACLGAVDAHEGLRDIASNPKQDPLTSTLTSGICMLQ